MLYRNLCTQWGSGKWLFLAINLPNLDPYRATTDTSLLLFESSVQIEIYPGQIHVIIPGSLSVWRRHRGPGRDSHGQRGPGGARHPAHRHQEPELSAGRMPDTTRTVPTGQ